MAVVCTRTIEVTLGYLQPKPSSCNSDTFARLPSLLAWRLCVTPTRHAEAYHLVSTCHLPLSCYFGIGLLFLVSSERLNFDSASILHLQHIFLLWQLACLSPASWGVASNRRNRFRRRHRHPAKCGAFIADLEVTLNIWTFFLIYIFYSTFHHNQFSLVLSIWVFSFNFLWLVLKWVWDSFTRSRGEISDLLHTE